MELRQLEYFIAVAEEANFTRAAERVRISQSGVSAQIRQLEHELHAVLIDRSGRTATLTAAGLAALGPARAALACVDAVRTAVDEVSGLVRGRIVVGMVTACTVTPLFEALAAFHQAHPGVEITLVEGDSEHLIAQVRTGAVDFALVGAAGEPPQGVNAFLVVSERLVAIVPTGHPLHDEVRPTLKAVCAYPLVSLTEGTGIRAVLDDACAAAGLRPDIALQASAPGAVVDLALRGLGVAVLSESMATPYRDRATALQIEDVETPAVLALIWTAALNPALRELVGHARRTFAISPAGAPR